MKEGRVKAITPEGVDVETASMEMALGGTWGWNPRAVKHFDTNGKEVHPHGSRWVLDDMPYAERKVEFEREKAIYKKFKEWKNLKNPTAEDVVTILREHSQARVIFAKENMGGMEWYDADEVLVAAGEYNVVFNSYPSPRPTISKKLVDELLDAGLIERDNDWIGATVWRLAKK